MPAAKSDRRGRKGEGEEVGIDGKRRERGTGNGGRMTTPDRRVADAKSPPSLPSALFLFAVFDDDDDSSHRSVVV